MRPFLEVLADCMKHQDGVPVGCYQEMGSGYHAPHRVRLESGQSEEPGPNLVLWTGSSHKYVLTLKEG